MPHVVQAMVRVLLAAGVFYSCWSFCSVGFLIMAFIFMSMPCWCYLGSCIVVTCSVCTACPVASVSETFLDTVSPLSRRFLVSSFLRLLYRIVFLGANLAGAAFLIMLRSGWFYPQFAPVHYASVCDAEWPLSTAVSYMDKAPSLYFAEGVVSKSDIGNGWLTTRSCGKRGYCSERTIFFRPIWACDPFDATATCATHAPCAYATSWSDKPHLDCGSLGHGICGVSYDLLCTGDRSGPSDGQNCGQYISPEEIRNSIKTVAAGDLHILNVSIPDGIPLLHMSSETSPDVMEQKLRSDFTVVIIIAALMIVQQLMLVSMGKYINMTTWFFQKEQPEETIEQPPDTEQPRDIEAGPETVGVAAKE